MPYGPKPIHDKAIAEIVMRGATFPVAAAAVGVSVATVGNALRRLGLRSPNQPIFRDVPCPSCGGPRGTHTLRCDACDRRHWRNGSCSCGVAKARTVAKCPRCGADWGRPTAGVGSQRKLPMPESLPAILHAIEAAGTQKAAAAILGVHVHTIHRRLSQWRRSILKRRARAS